MPWFSFLPFLPGRDASAAGNDDDCDVAALRRYQLRVLLGGGCLLSLAILLGMVALLLLHASSFQARRLEALQRTGNVVEAQLMASAGAHQRLLNMAEYAWQHRPDDTAASQQRERQRFLADGQRGIVSAGAESAPQMALGLGVDAWPVRRLDRYLTLAHSLSIIRRLSSTGEAGADRTSSYFFDPSGQLLVLGDGLTEQGLRAATGSVDRAALFQRLQALAAPGPTPAGMGQDAPEVRRLVRHPLSGTPSIAVRLAARDSSGLIGTFVSLEPTHRLAEAMAAVDAGTTFVVAADGRVVAGTGSATDLPLARVLQAVRHERGSSTGVASYRIGMRFYLVAAVPGTDWALVSTYCIDDIARDGRRLHVFGAVLGGGLLLGLWTLLAWLHRRVFGPALSRAARVYQGEQLSRALIQLSPVGLCLIDRAQGGPVLQNELMRHYAASAERSGIPLYLQMAREAVDARADAGPQDATEFELRLPGNQIDAGRLLLVGAIGASYQGRDVLLCAVRDLSARMELEQQQARAREAAEAASLAKSAFLATMSHEIRTPLHGILGHLELLGRSPLDGDQQARLRRISQSADSLLLIINDVLDFSRAESGQLDLQAETFEPVMLLERVALLFAPLAEAKGLVLDLAVDRALPAQVSGAQARIEQVLRNLLSNAVKFTPSGRVELRARAGGTGQAPTLLLEVADSGIGLTPLQLDRLFQPYVQADSSIITRFGGSGLGLSLCRELCRRMGGEIQAHSTPGVGSVFSFEVPITVPVQAVPRLPLAGRRVLLASAASGWRDEWARRLHVWGAQVQVIDEVAADGSDDLDPAAPLLQFDRAPHAAPPPAGGGRRVVRVTADGPLRPLARGTVWWVSCYAGEAVLQALLAPQPPLREGGNRLAVERSMD